MDIEVVKTNQLTQIQKEAICNLFEQVFGIKKTYEEFIHQFERNEFGFSYFGLIYNNEEVVGSYAVIPFRYRYFDSSVVFGQSVDTMISEKYRGNPFLLKRLAEKVYKKLKADNINFVFGFPNDNIYLVRKKVLKWVDIYNLDIYLLPLRPSAFKSLLKPLDIFMVPALTLLNAFVKNKSEAKENFNIYKEISPEYLKYRFTDDYKKISLFNNGYCFYKIENFKNINTAFIVDVYPLTKRNIELAVKLLYQSHKAIDLITYFGYLPFSPINLFKVPEKYKPKDTFMSGKILNNEKISEKVFNIKNWRINLSNFDWI